MGKHRKKTRAEKLNEFCIKAGIYEAVATALLTLVCTYIAH